MVGKQFPARSSSRRSQPADGRDKLIDTQGRVRQINQLTRTSGVTVPDGTTLFTAVPTGRSPTKGNAARGTGRQVDSREFGPRGERDVIGG